MDPMFLANLRRKAVWNFNPELARLPAIVSSTWGRNRINDSMTKVDLEAGTGLKNFVRAEQRKVLPNRGVGVLAV